MSCYGFMRIDNILIYHSSSLIRYMGRTFAKRNEGKNEAKQKGKPQRSKAIKKQTNIIKQNIAYLPPIPLFRQLFSQET